MTLKESNNEIVALKKIIIDKEKEIFRLKNIIDNFPGDVYWKDTNGIYLGINLTGSKSLQKMELTWKPSEILGKTDYDIHEKSIAEEYRKNDLEVMQSKTEIIKEESVILSSGEKKTQLSRKRPLRDEHGNIIGIIGNTIDITELKKTQEELQEIKHKLEGANLISSSIAHEIRTPLATIKSAMQGIRNTLSALISINELVHKKNLGIKTVTNQEIKLAEKAINSVNKKVDQSNSIINMLLTKLQSIDFEFSEFSLTSACDCIQDAMREFIVPDDMINKISFNKGNNFKFLGSRILITHVVMNLLKNAIYFILKANKGEITIWLENHIKNNEIHFKDTGTGIAPEILPHIFDSFFTTETSTGTGVGLAFSKMVMQSHRGMINCKSKEGEYTEFVLSFPKLDKE